MNTIGLTVFPSRDAWQVRVIDPRRPRGSRCLRVKYFLTKAEADVFYAAMRAAHTDPAFEVTLTDCMI